MQTNLVRQATEDDLLKAIEELPVAMTTPHIDAERVLVAVDVRLELVGRYR